MRRRKKLHAYDCSFDHLTLILLLHYFVKMQKSQFDLYTIHTA